MEWWYYPVIVFGVIVVLGISCLLWVFGQTRWSRVLALMTIKKIGSTEALPIIRLEDATAFSNTYRLHWTIMGTHLKITYFQTLPGLQSEWICVKASRKSWRFHFTDGGLNYDPKDLDLVRCKPHAQEALLALRTYVATNKGVGTEPLLH